MKITDQAALNTLRQAVAAHRALDMALHTGRPHARHVADRDAALAVLRRAGRAVTLYELDGYDRPETIKRAPAEVAA